MKKKLIIIILITTIFTILIYNSLKNNKVYYVALGDNLTLGIEDNVIGYSYSDFLKDKLLYEKKLSFYSKNFAKKDLRIKELKELISKNDYILLNNDKLYIQQALANADLITINIGLTDLKSEIKIEEIEMLMNDYETIINKIKKLNYKRIIIIGYNYNDYDFQNKRQIQNQIKYANNILENICHKNSITFIDITNVKNKSELTKNILISNLIWSQL